MSVTSTPMVWCVLLGNVHECKVLEKNDIYSVVYFGTGLGQKSAVVNAHCFKTEREAWDWWLEDTRSTLDYIERQMTARYGSEV